MAINYNVDIGLNALRPLRDPLSSLADQMAKQRAEDEERRRWEAQQALQWEAQVGAPDRRHAETMAWNKAKLEADKAAAVAEAAAKVEIEKAKRDREAGKAVEDSKVLLRRGDLSGANTMGAPLGFNWQPLGPDPTKIAQATMRENDGTERAQSALPQLGLGLGTLGMFGGGIEGIAQAGGNVAQGTQEAQQGAAARAAEEKARRYQLTLPSGRSETYDVDAAMAAERAEAERVANLARGAGLGDYMPQVRAMREAGASDVDALKTGIDGQKFDDQQEGADRRAAVARAAAAGRHNDLNPYQAEMLSREERKRRILTRAGAPTLAISTEEGEKIRVARGAMVAFEKMIGSAEALIDRDGTKLIDGNPLQTTQVKDRNAIAQSLIGKLTVLNATGVLQNPEYERYKALIRAGFWQSPEEAKQNLRTIVGIIHAEYDAKIESQNVGEGGSGQPRAQGGSAPAPQPATEDDEDLNKAGF